MDEQATILGQYVHYFAGQVIENGSRGDNTHNRRAYLLSVLLLASATDNRNAKALNHTYNEGLAAAAVEQGVLPWPLKVYSTEEWRFFRRITFGEIAGGVTTYSTDMHSETLLEGVKAGEYTFAEHTEIQHLLT